MLEESSRLEPMIGQVLAYGQAHPDQFGSYGLVWQGADASVFVSFTTDVDRHRDELTAQVPYPDELVVCQVAITGDQAMALQTQLGRELADRAISVGTGGNGVAVVLTADQEMAAQELVDRYGDAVDVSVGALAFPLDTAEDVCVDTTPVEPPPGLTIEAVTGETLVRNGAEVTGAMVRLSNTGASDLFVSAASATAVLTDRTGRPVNVDVGLQALIGTPISLAPGASTDLPMTVSLASCRADLGYVLPPGRYAMSARITVDGGTIQSTAVEVDIT